MSDLSSVSADSTRWQSIRAQQNIYLCHAVGKQRSVPRRLRKKDLQGLGISTSGKKSPLGARLGSQQATGQLRKKREESNS